MFFLPADYDTTTDLNVALDKYFSGAATIYIAKAEYDLHRDCDKQDFFINTLLYTVKNGYVDDPEDPGFEDYTPPTIIYDVVYYDGNFTTYQNTTATYSPGGTITFEVIGVSELSPITGYEVNAVISTQYGDSASNIVLVDASDDDADFSFSIPNTWLGVITVTTALAGAITQAVKLGYSESPYSLGTLEYSDSLGLATVYPDVPIGDLNNDGLLAVGDTLLRSGRNYDFRLGAAKHLNVTLYTSEYNPLIPNNQVGFSISPVTTDYSFQTTTNGPSYSGQKKELADLTAKVLVSNGSTVSTHSLDFTSLQANGTYVSSVNLSDDFDSTVALVFYVLEANNTLTLPVSAQTATLSGASVWVNSTDTTTVDFEPSDVVNFRLNEPSSYSSIYYSLYSQVYNSTIKVEGFTASDFSGTPEVSETIPISVPDNGGFMSSTAVTLPATVDRDLYFKTSWVSQRVSNLIYFEAVFDTPVDLANIGSLSVSPNRWDPDDTAETITITFTADEGVTASDYEIDLYPTLELQANNFFVLATSSALSSTATFTFSRNNVGWSTTPVDRIKIRYSISEA